MLEVTFRIVPFGDYEHENLRTIGTLKIGFQGYNQSGEAEYISVLHSDAQYPPENKIVAVENRRETGAWPLVMKALQRHIDLDYQPPENLIDGK